MKHTKCNFLKEKLYLNIDFREVQDFTMCKNCENIFLNVTKVFFWIEKSMSLKFILYICQLYFLYCGVMKTDFFRNISPKIRYILLRFLRIHWKTDLMKKRIFLYFYTNTRNWNITPTTCIALQVIVSLCNDSLSLINLACLRNYNITCIFFLQGIFATIINSGWWWSALFKLRDHSFKYLPSFPRVFTIEIFSSHLYISFLMLQFLRELWVSDFTKTIFKVKYHPMRVALPLCGLCDYFL